MYKIRKYVREAHSPEKRIKAQQKHNHYWSSNHGDPFKVPVQVDTITTSFVTKCTLDLSYMAKDLLGAKFNPSTERFPGLRYVNHWTGVTTTIFSTGSMVISRCHTCDEIDIAIKHILSLLKPWHILINKNK